MYFNNPNSVKLVMTFVTSMAAAIGTSAGASVWQAFGKPKVEKIAEKHEKPKRKIGFVVDD